MKFLYIISISRDTPGNPLCRTITAAYLREEVQVKNLWRNICFQAINVCVWTVSLSKETSISNLLKTVALVFQPMRSKTKTNYTFYGRLYCTCVLSKLWVIARNSDWLVALFLFLLWLVGVIMVLWYWFFNSHLKTALKGWTKSDWIQKLWRAM